MKLSTLLSETGCRIYAEPDTESDPEITRISTELNEVIPGTLFTALPGLKFDGHSLCEKAAEMGAAALLTERPVPVFGTVNAVVRNTRKALALVAAAFYGYPSAGMKLIGITGTNGKTTTAYMLSRILERAGMKTAIIGTAGYTGAGQAQPAPYTTPEPILLHRQLSLIKNGGADYTVMEVSSQALDQKRVYGLEFSTGIFTNLTADHLDYHKTMEAYRQAKLSLLSMCGKRLINLDCAAFSGLCGLPGVRTFSVLPSSVYTDNCKKSDFTAFNIKIGGGKGILPETSFSIASDYGIHKVTLSLPGLFNVYNALGAFGAACLEGTDPDIAAQALSDFTGVCGRCEVVNAGTDFGIVIDFAHTPDGLANILSAVRPFVSGRLICVFGCGGDRDKSKRPVMGKIASEHSDIAVVTSDNPRSEPPMTIINDILSGIQCENTEVIPDRRAAIRRALLMSKKGDLVLIAGKGHETYQITCEGKKEFDERKIIREILAEENLTGTEDIHGQ